MSYVTGVIAKIGQKSQVCFGIMCLLAVVIRVYDNLVDMLNAATFCFVEGHCVSDKRKLNCVYNVTMIYDIITNTC